MTTKNRYEAAALLYMQAIASIREGELLDESGYDGRSLYQFGRGAAFLEAGDSTLESMGEARGMSPSATERVRKHLLLLASAYVGARAHEIATAAVSRQDKPRRHNPRRRRDRRD